MAQWNTVTSSEIQSARRSDAEFFKRDYVASLEKVRRANGISLRRLGIDVVSGPFGSSLKSSDYTTHGIPLIRISDLRNFFINKDKLVFISEVSHRRIIGSEIRPGDLVLSKVGNSIGIVSMLDADFSRANISENNIAIRFRSQTPLAAKHFLLAYLNCAFGQNEILRRRSGNAQPKLNISDIFGLELPRVSEETLVKISQLVSEVQKSLNRSQEYYSEAQRLLDAALGMDKASFQRRLGYTALFSEIEGARRADADYFQVPFRQMHKLLDACQTVPLYRLASMIKGIEVGSNAYTESGRLFLRVSNLKETQLQFGVSDKYISESLHQSLQAFRPNIGELLLTKDGSPGICFAVDEAIDGIVSGGIVRLRPFGEGVPNEYLALAINSQACRMQIEQECSGALILHWKPSSIRRLRIPMLSRDAMLRIANLVTESKQAKRESVTSLQKAKASVEQLIEGAKSA